MKNLLVLLCAALLCLSACSGGDDEPDVIVIEEEESELLSVEDDGDVVLEDGEDSLTDMEEEEPAPAAPDEEAAGPQSATPVRSLQSSGAMTQGTYTAVSTTAMGVTGNMSFDSDLINFGKGQTITTRLTEMVPATAPYNQTGDSWASLLFIPDEAKVEIREIVGMTTSEDAQPLCGEAPQWVGVGTDRGLKDSSVSVTIVLATGGVPPGPDAPEDNICATYTFSE